MKGTDKLLKGTTTRYERTIDRNKGTIEWLEGTIEWLEGTIEWLEGTIEWLEGTIERLEGTIEWLEGTIERLEGTIEQLEGTVERLEGTIEWLEGTVEWLEGTINLYGGASIKIDKSFVVERHRDMADYIPRSDAEFDIWQANFVTFLNDYLTDLELTSDRIALVTAAQNQWTTAYNDHVLAQSAAESARQNKDDCRKTYKSELRQLVNQLQANPKMTDALRQGLGITVPKRSLSPMGAPTTRPVARMEAKGRYLLKIYFVDETTPTRRAKPSGVLGSEIWVKMGDAPPNDPGELSFVALKTATPYVMEFGGEDVGKTAYFMLRWVNKKGEFGPWSETVSMRVPG